jgi:hypothetical protein
MLFPQDIFNYILEFNGIYNNFSKKFVNFIRYASADDLEIVLKNVLNIEYNFKHTDLSRQRRKILLKMLFTQSHPDFIFNKLLNHYEMMNNIYSYRNYGFKIGDEILYFRGSGITYCGLITKINHKSIKMKTYAYELRTGMNWENRLVPFRYWIKNEFDNKHINITTRIENVYKNDRTDSTINRENFIRIRQYY